MDTGLLAYLISYRDHVGFSENCIEQIFADIFARMKPEKLLVFGWFTPRGGIAIHPFRANYEIPFHNGRLIYQ
jgi:7-cyano-7-deazaguanine reductase